MDNNRLLGYVEAVVGTSAATANNRVYTPAALRTIAAQTGRAPAVLYAHRGKPIGHVVSLRVLPPHKARKWYPADDLHLLVAVLAIDLGKKRGRKKFSQIATGELKEYSLGATLDAYQERAGITIVTAARLREISVCPAGANWGTLTLCVDPDTDLERRLRRNLGGLLLRGATRPERLRAFAPPS